MKKLKNMNIISFNTGLVLILSIIVCFLYEFLFNKKLEGFYTTSTKPGTTNPASTNPASTNPSLTNPASTNPSLTNPALTNPATTNTASTNPATTKPASTNPASTNPASTNPSTTQFLKNEVTEDIGDEIEKYAEDCPSYKEIINHCEDIDCNSFKEDNKCYKLLNKHLQDFNNENNNCNTKNPFKIRVNDYQDLLFESLDKSLQEKGCNYKIDKSKFQVESKTTTPQLTKQEEKELDTIVKSLDKGLDSTIDKLISSDKNMNIVGYDGILNIFSPKIN